MKQTPSNSIHGLFITGTDTDAGKTYVSACIGYTLHKYGLTVSPRKPVASGCMPNASGELSCIDAEQLKKGCHSSEPIEAICPYRFEPPISPQRAIKQAGQFISNAELATACAVPKGNFALIEGAGGFYSPLSSDGLNADLAQTLNYPVILVVGNKLGCINHALLTLDAIQKRDLTIAAVIINDLSAKADIQNFHDLKERMHALNIHCLHHPFSDNSEFCEINEILSLL
ncbi:dethiobiotin synthase [Thiomicrorhabdus sp. zzn3]|uniref:dethiobiotin synthase n=1 Tax=Thiomicrorhabdus sp. zzn3 TaxID=3039775 RepID=UPI002437422F|nr:dethiobiotin synthase [Thiomicrorhabdus sp. zzn3]MDG6778994.1 dethiobiotin synthase [Thiomicrorhabdus sp. zzn3]